MGILRQAQDDGAITQDEEANAQDDESNTQDDGVIVFVTIDVSY